MPVSPDNIPSVDNRWKLWNRVFIYNKNISVIEDLDWCVENCTKGFDVHTDLNNRKNQVWIFESTEDALIFKLRHT